MGIVTVHLFDPIRLLGQDTVVLRVVQKETGIVSGLPTGWWGGPPPTHLNLQGPTGEPTGSLWGPSVGRPVLVLLHRS